MSSKKKECFVKTIGCIGGTSWQSTIEYYRIINEEIAERLGGLHSSRMILFSVDFHEYEQLMKKGDWKGVTRRLADIAVNLKKAGAEGIVICTNTMHKVAREVESAAGIPLLHIAEAVAEEITRQGSITVGLLGTRLTMEEDFYPVSLQDFGIDIVIPSEKDRKIVDDIIFGELCRGVHEERSKNELLRIMDQLIEKGAEGIILGCTELPLVIGNGDVSFPLFDTTFIHARYAAEWSLNN